MGKPVLIALFPADKEAFAWGGDGSQVPVPVGINMGGKWQKSIYPVKAHYMAYKWGENCFKLFIRRYICLLGQAPP